MADVEKVIQGMKCCENYIYRDHDNCPYQSTCYHDGVSKALISDVLSVIRELKSENDRLKQEKLINVDKLREKLGFAESCDKCKKDSWQCQRDMYFSEMDFCNRLDIAIEELMQEGR